MCSWLRIETWLPILCLATVYTYTYMWHSIVCVWVGGKGQIQMDSGLSHCGSWMEFLFTVVLSVPRFQVNTAWAGRWERFYDFIGAMEASLKVLDWSLAHRSSVSYTLLGCVCVCARWSSSLRTFAGSQSLCGVCSREFHLVFMQPRAHILAHQFQTLTSIWVGVELLCVFTNRLRHVSSHW